MNTKTALGLRISADWGHIRRVDTTSVRQTYRIPPRTTVAGLLAGIIGRPRDSYYETFQNDVSDIAISVTRPIQVTQMAVQQLTTNKDALKSNEFPSDGILKRESTSQVNRQRSVHEWLVNPQYEIWVALEDRDFYAELRQHLESGRSQYTPCLGLSECLADIEYIGEHTLETTDKLTVDSTILSKQLESITNVSTERSPAFSKKTNGKRQSDGFQTIAFSDKEQLEVTPGTTVYKTPDAKTERITFR